MGDGSGPLRAHRARGCITSAVAGRFGLWQGTFDWEYFAKFQQYAAEVNSFMPAAVIPEIAWTATVAEATMAMFGTAMAISFGLKSPMDYSVFSASSAAALLSLHAFSQNRNQAAFEKH